MSEWASFASGAIAALLGSGVAGVIALRAGKLEREARDRDGLAATLAQYSHALDRLEMEIAGLPPQPGRVGAASQRLVARLTTFDWAVGQAARYSVGRPVRRVLELHSVAASRLSLEAPPEVLVAMEPIAKLLGRTDEARSEQWRAEWRGARSKFIVVARTALGRG